MQNKRWKRKAKRLKGTCINTRISECAHGKCKYDHICFKVNSFYAPMGEDIITL